MNKAWNPLENTAKVFLCPSKTYQKFYGQCKENESPSFFVQMKEENVIKGDWKTTYKNWTESKVYLFMQAAISIFKLYKLIAITQPYLT